MAVSSSNPLSNRPDLSAKIPKLLPRRRKENPSSDPGPETPALPLPPSLQSVHFAVPTRRILSKKDHDLFLASPTYQTLLGFVFGLSDSVHGKAISSVSKDSLTPTTNAILSILDEAEALVVTNPPLDTGSRFGNPAFRSFFDAVTKHLPEWHTQLALPQAAIAEVSTYLQHSFGSASRIDYGSGHELNFLLWLLCLNRLNLLPTSTFPALTLVVFPRYLKLMRTVQTTYYLEPAGSHGVWGLDDYQFLPFLFGSAQLLHHPFVTPKSIHNDATLDEFSHDFLYLDQVAFVNSVKNVEGLRWHSPMLDDISAAKSWAKIEGGMRKMFVKEVLGKLPVMQHFFFGGLIQADENMSVDTEGDGHTEGHEGHDHQEGVSAWGDCCGIAVPSSIGAAQEMKKRMGGEGLRRLPFD
ncbi:Serine/threonine-protein phosphatase 2A activator [Venturia nashicola]|uniref:Serine/threonine-protein phosphatase 2A activator n=1 Tax=Venturia nashicola TaxID=86259 RepID=A0A4Z1NUM0_9PEZI|nr:Serine/threonine-protein phosphatase 2A activator [Venturia nashicola]TLD27869.1 Serine/threonine-protein phosphatase 2A activator [Venturia nashicola]